MTYSLGHLNSLWEEECLCTGFCWKPHMTSPSVATSLNSCLSLVGTTSTCLFHVTFTGSSPKSRKSVTFMHQIYSPPLHTTRLLFSVSTHCQNLRNNQIRHSRNLSQQFRSPISQRVTSFISSGLTRFSHYRCTSSTNSLHTEGNE
jgi:hypothetical protein